MSGNDMVDARGDGGNADETDARGQPRGLPRMSEAAFSSLQYDMRHQNRGVAVIISNTNFQPRIDAQIGYSLSGQHEHRDSSADATAMNNLLQTMRFKNIQTYTDQTAADMRRILQNVAREDHTNNDCFLCVILTHGDHGYVYSTDDKIPVDELVQPFKGDACRSLAGKPKIFLIQSSKGFMPEAEELFHECEGEEAMDEETVRRIPTEADILLVYSLIPAWRNCSRQSWFIQAISEVFSQNCQTMDLLTMITRVNKKVAYYFETTAKEEFEIHHRQIPCITSMLTKDVIFTQ